MERPTPHRDSAATTANGPNRRAEFALWALALGLCALAYRPLALGRLPISSDLTMWFEPYASLRWDGGFPLWNPHQACGVPLDGNLQFAAPYPLRWIFFVIPDWRVWFGRHVLLHCMIAMAGTVGAVRALGGSRLASLLGAALFVFGGYMAGRPVNIMILLGSAWMPWCVWGAASRGRWAGLAAAFAMAMTVCVGSPHMMLYNALAYGLTAALILSPWRAKAWRARVRLPLFFALGVAGGAAALAPGLARVGQSLRTETTVERNLQGSLAWGELPRAVLGGTGSGIYPEQNDKTFYIGGAAAALIIAGSMRRRTWRDPAWLLGCALGAAGLALALGKNIGWQWAMPFIPGLRYLEGPARALGLAALGAAILAARSLDALPHLSRRGRALAATTTTLAAALAAWRWLPSAISEQPLPDAFHAWLTAPATPVHAAFPAFDAPLSLALGAALALLGSRAARWRAPALIGFILLQLAHFSPRVKPELVDAAYFDPPPPVEFLQSRAASEPPFRACGIDALQSNDIELHGRLTRSMMAPNLSTLYGIDGVGIFDPLIDRRHRDLLRETSGLPPYNDSLRKAEPSRPDAALFELLGIRYLVGGPFERRLTNLPQILTPDAPSQEIAALADPANPANPAAAPREPIEAWRLVSMVELLKRVRGGEPIARLRVSAEEGEFEFPLRYAIETAGAREPDASLKTMRVRPYMEWRRHVSLRAAGYTERMLNYAATIEFGRPLRVKNARWELLRQDGVLFIPSQAYRITPTTEERESWRLVYPNDAAPVFEFLHAGDRAYLAASLNPPANERAPAAAPGTVEFKRRSVNGAELEIDAPQAGWLVVRERWVPGWRAWIDGARAECVEAPPYFRAIRIPPGRHQIRMRYTPTGFYWWLAFGWASLAGAAALCKLRALEPKEPNA